MSMTFSEQLAAVLLGLITGDELPDIATTALVEEFDSPSLAALAGQSSTAYDPVENRRLWDKALAELGIPAPTVMDAAKCLVQAYARMVVRGEMKPLGAAAKVTHVVDGVYKASQQSGYVHVSDSIGVTMITYYHYEYGTCDLLDKTEIDDKILSEFERIANNSGE